MPELFGTRYRRAELLRRIGRLEQVAGVRLVTIGDGQGRGVRDGRHRQVRRPGVTAGTGQVYNGRPAQEVMTTKVDGGFIVNAEL
jgi:hypothetical protein